MLPIKVTFYFSLDTIFNFSFSYTTYKIVYEYILKKKKTEILSLKLFFFNKMFRLCATKT